MDEFVLGPLFARTHSKSLKTSGDQTNGHTHAEDHITVVWGKHRMTIEAPLRGEDGAQKTDPITGEPLWVLESERVLTGNGPDSIVFIAASKKHNLILLDPTGYHACLFLHKDGEGKTSAEWQGYIDATR